MPRHSRHVHAHDENVPQVPVEQSFLKQCGCHCHPHRTTVTATPLFFGRWRVERMMIGDFNLSTKTIHTSFIHATMLLPSGALDCSHCKGISCPSCGLGIHTALVEIFLSEQAFRAYFPNSST
jgi:hypothetical protein